MKYLLMAVMVAPFLASCAHPLERIVDEQRQQRNDTASANRPINSGAGDGLGAYIAQSESGLTLMSTGK